VVREAISMVSQSLYLARRQIISEIQRRVSSGMKVLENHRFEIAQRI